MRGEVAHALAIEPGKRWIAGRSRKMSSSGAVATRAGLERAEPLAQHERPRERLLHRHLLVEREADEQRERVLDEQHVGLVVVGEVEAVGQRSGIVARTRVPSPRGLSTSSRPPSTSTRSTQPEQAGPARRVGAADAVVGDLDHERVALVAIAHVDPARLA